MIKQARNLWPWAVCWIGFLGGGASLWGDTPSDPVNRPGDKIVARIVPMGENPFIAIQSFRLLEMLHDPKDLSTDSHLIIRVTGVYDSFVCTPGTTPTFEYHYLAESDANREVILPRIRQIQIETRSVLAGSKLCPTLQEPREFEIDLRFEAPAERPATKRRWELRFVDGSGSKLATLQIAYAKDRGWSHQNY